MYHLIVHQAPIPNFSQVSDIFARKLHLIGVNGHPYDELLRHFSLSKSELKQEAADSFTDSDSDAEFESFSESEIVDSVLVIAKDLSCSN